MSESLFNRNTIIKATAGSLLAAVAVSGCASGVSPERNDRRVRLEESMITDGVNVRNDPVRDDGYNECFTAETATFFEEQLVQVANETDPNGPWYGFDIDKSDPKVQKDCKDDKDGTVWVSGQVFSVKIVPENDGAYKPTK